MQVIWNSCWGKRAVTWMHGWLSMHQSVEWHHILRLHESRVQVLGCLQGLRITDILLHNLHSTILGSGDDNAPRRKVQRQAVTSWIVSSYYRCELSVSKLRSYTSYSYSTVLEYLCAVCRTSEYLRVLVPCTLGYCLQFVVLFQQAWVQFRYNYAAFLLHSYWYARNKLVFAIFTTLYITIFLLPVPHGNIGYVWYYDECCTLRASLSIDEGWVLVYKFPSGRTWLHY
jgi:hypothetical protein